MACLSQSKADVYIGDWDGGVEADAESHAHPQQLVCRQSKKGLLGLRHTDLSMPLVETRELDLSGPFNEVRWPQESVTHQSAARLVKRIRAHSMTFSTFMSELLQVSLDTSHCWLLLLRGMNWSIIALDFLAFWLHEAVCTDAVLQHTNHDACC